MDSLETRERNLLIAAAVCMVAAAIWYWLLPMYSRYGQLESKIKTNVEKIRSAQTQASRLEELVKGLRDTKSELKVARRKLPRQGRFSQLLSTLEQHARKSGIADRKIQEFNRGGTQETKDGVLREMTIRASFQNINMAQLTEMLWRFDNMTRMVDVKNFSNSKLKKKKDGSVQFNVKLTLAVYMVKKKAQKKSGKSV